MKAQTQTAIKTLSNKKTNDELMSFNIRKTCIVTYLGSGDMQRAYKLYLLDPLGDSTDFETFIQYIKLAAMRLVGGDEREAIMSSFGGAA